MTEEAPPRSPIGPTITQSSLDRARWLARNLLPYEAAIRARLRQWRLPDDLDEEDILQEVYGKFVAMPDVTAIRNPRSYALAAARSIVLMHIRHSRVVSIRAVDDLDALAVAADDPSPEQYASDREQLALLAVAVSELPEASRRAFLMRTVEELSHREIGLRLGISDNAVQKSIAKSLVLLLNRLGRGGNNAPRASMRSDPAALSEDHVQTRDQ